MDEKEFVKNLKKLSINVDQEKLDKLNQYYELLIEWNEKINLTAITEKKEVYLKHFYDSLTIVKAVNLEEIETLCDVGSGAGFPGIVLKIFFPNLKIVLIDSLNKRIKFLNLIIKELDLKDIVAKHERMEDYSKLNEEVFDLVTARAVSNTAVLAEISSRAIKVGGSLVLLKGQIDTELKQSKAHLEKLGFAQRELISFKLPIEESLRNIIVFEKTRITNKLYPRTVDRIKKELKI